MLYYAGIPRDDSAYAAIYTGMVVTIFRPQQKIGRMGCFTIKLDVGDFRRNEKTEDEILDKLAAIVTPREELDEVLIAISSRKQPRGTISMPPPSVGMNESV